MLEARVYHQEVDDYSGLSEYIGIFPENAYGDKFKDVAGNAKPYNYLTFDGLGVNLLDENLKFFKTGDFRGYTLPYISNDIAEIDQIEPIKFDFDWFTTKPRHLTLLSDIDKFGSVRVEKRCYINGENIDTVETLTVDSNKIEIELPEEISTVNIYFLTTPYPNQYVRISSVTFGVIDDYNQFKNSHLFEEINVLSDDLPINQFEATIVVPDGDNVTFTKKDPLNLFSNNKYYGTFYITDIQRVGKNFFEITAQDVLTIYDHCSFEKWEVNYENGGVKVSDIVEEINRSTNRNLNTTGLNLNSTIVGDKRDGNCRLALCELGYCFNKMIDTSRNDGVSFKPIPSEPTSEILTSSDRIIGDAVLKKTDEISAAELYFSEIQTQGLTENSYNLQTIEGSYGEVLTVSFPTPVYIDMDFFSSGFELLSYTLYSAKIKLTTSSATLAYYPRLKYEHIETVVNLNAPINRIDKYNQIALKVLGLIEFDNKKAYVEKYIKSVGVVKAKIRLRDEKVGDLIKIETAWDGIITGIITKMNIAFGYEDIADIEVLEWSL